MLPNGETCGGCCFWDVQDMITRTGTRLGKCRQGSPKVIEGLDGRARTVFPLTGAEDWCGDHATHENQ